MPAEVDLAAKEGAGQRDKGSRRIEQGLDAEHVDESRLPEIAGDQWSGQQLHERERSVQQQQQSECLRDSAPVDRFALHQGARESVAVHQIEEDQNHLRHREQAVIGRLEQADDEKGRSPGDELRDDLAAGPPEDRAPHSLRQASRLIFLEFFLYRHCVRWSDHARSGPSYSRGVNSRFREAAVRRIADSGQKAG